MWTVITILIFVNVAYGEYREKTVNLNPADYLKCMDGMNVKLNTFEVLPIYGWDNLRNQYAGMVISSNYSKCKLTIDGKYLIPDDVYLIPQRISKIEQFAELITHWHNYSSVTSKSINAEAGLSFHGLGISGKYSNDYLHAKSKQVLDKSDVTRVQLRYIGYVSKLQPNANLHPNFKKALQHIASSIQVNHTDEARYLSELVVRDYGTHFVNSITAGAALVQEDFVSRELVLKNEENKRSILASASANFFGVVHASFKTQTSTDNKMRDSYDKSITSSHIIAYGGSMYTFQNYSVNKWAEKLNDNLVAMDRSGDPLYFLITPDSLPEIPAQITYQVRDYVKQAMLRYYEYNVHRGCMDQDSPNFSFQANIDDGSCKQPASNLTFGGVYQQCEMTRSDAGNLCGKLSQPNPKTGQFSCPKHYEVVKLYTEKYQKSVPYRNCRHCGFLGWSRCCSSGTRYSFATLTVFWCAATGRVPENSGYLFGGVFTSHVDNPVTMDKSCPEAFSTRMIGSELKLCISDDYELGTPGALPFGGFFSCSGGNPLANREQQKTLTKKKDQALLTLEQYYRQSGSYSGPKACPKGYSQHLAIISQECSVYYCIMSGALSPRGLFPIQRPPFSEEPSYVPEIEDFFIYNPNSSTWELSDISVQELKSGEFDLKKPTSSTNENEITPGVSATIAVCVTLFLMGIVFLGTFYYRRQRKGKRTTRDLQQEAPIVGNTYGSTE